MLVNQNWAEKAGPRFADTAAIHVGLGNRGGVTFGDVDMMWYPNQGDSPLVSSRGQFQDHIGLSVEDLDAWTEKLKGEGVTFLSEAYPLGDTRAIMIEGPSREALVLVEVR